MKVLEFFKYFKNRKGFRLRIKSIFILILIFSISCSTIKFETEFKTFYNNTELINKNIIYIYEELQKQELNLKALSSVNKESIRPSDLKPEIIKFSDLDIRRESLEYISEYTKLLYNIISSDNRDEVIKNTKKTFENLNNLNNKNENLFTKKELSTIMTIIHSISQSFTLSKKRYFLIKIMKTSQPILEKLSKRIKKEFLLTKTLLYNYYTKEFRDRIAINWPKKESKREKIAKTGIKILKMRYETNKIINYLIKAIDLIPETHKELLSSFKKNKSFIHTLLDLTQLAYETKEIYLRIKE